MKKFFIVIFTFTLFSSFAQMTMIIQPDCEGKDASVRTDSPTSNFFADANFIANSWTVGGSPFNQRSFIEFDLNCIPENSQIMSVKISLYCNRKSGHQQLQSGINASYLSRVVGTWGEYALNWNEQPEITTDNQVLLPTSTSNTQDYENIDITNLAIDAINENDGILGLRLKLETELFYACMVFASSDNENPNIHPKITVEYNCDIPVASFSFENSDHLVHFISNSTNISSIYWNFGDGNYSELNAPIHYFENPGIYGVSLLAINECSASLHIDTVTIIIDDLPVLNAMGRSGEILVYPSIVNETIGLYNPDDSDQKNFDLLIFNETGQFMKTVNNLCIPPGVYITVSVSNLKAGMYYLFFKGRHHSQTEKIIKN